jgi:AcrR family transcriptional regulator
VADRRRAQDGDRPVFAAADAARAPGVRREGDREVPAGPRAERTRLALMASAYELFTTSGYHETTVADIAEHASVSLGTFYQYFRDRSDVVAAIVRTGISLFLEQTDTRWRTSEGRTSLYRLIHAFVSAYADGAAFSRLWEEVSHIDSELAELRRDLARLMTETVERELIRGGSDGHCRTFTRAEAKLVARALAGMVDRFCYVSYVFDPADSPPSVDESSRVLTDLWADAIGLASERDG